MNAEAGTIQKAPDPSENSESLHRAIAELRAQIEHVIAGQSELIDSLFIGILTGGHILIEGVPGLAKTLTVKTFAQCIGGAFSRIQFTPDLLPSDITGCQIYQPDIQQFRIKRGPIYANIVLGDEINRASARTQSALLEVMQEKQVTIDRETIKMPEPFLVAATRNPIEQRGTYPLPEAQKDRFLMQVNIQYPSRQEEQIVLERSETQVLQTIDNKISLEILLQCKRHVEAVHSDAKIYQYILDLVIATRPGQQEHLSPAQQKIDLQAFQKQIQLGASPRASISLLSASKAVAFLAGRDYVLPHDVRKIAPAVLRHRIQLNFSADPQKNSVEYVIQQLLKIVQIP